MNEDELVLFFMKEMLTALSPEDLAKVEECAIKIRTLVAEYSDIGQCALGLVGAEVASKETSDSLGGVQ